MKPILSFLILVAIHINSIAQGQTNSEGQPIYTDIPFFQEYSVKYYLPRNYVKLKSVGCDRNGEIQVISNGGLMTCSGGAFLQPGKIVPNRRYRPLADKEIRDVKIYQDQFVYLDDKSVFSNAWAGNIFLHHTLPAAKILSLGEDFECLISDQKNLQYLRPGQPVRTIDISGGILDLKFEEGSKLFWVLTSDAIYRFDPEMEDVEKVIAGASYRAFAITGDRKIISVVNDGVIEYLIDRDFKSRKVEKLPVEKINCVSVINDHLWYGSPQGAFMLRDDGKYNYYYGERWLTGNKVINIAPGAGRDVLLLSDNGLSRISFKEITLQEKAEFFDKQVRSRHIRHGFNAGLSSMIKGDIATGYLRDSDNDGLWTSMYLAGEVFRYAVTKSEEALQNCRESLDAMERLYTINPVPGFPSRSFVRRGYIDQLADPHRWQHAQDPEWDWKATTSSDEAIGHIFAFGVIAELIPDSQIKSQAIRLIDTLMSHIVKNDLYLIDYDGKHTTWGRWHPDYVNGFPKMVGDRKLNSSNITGMLQTAYHFTGKDKYKEKALELLYDHGYLENLRRPIAEIGKAGEDADEWSKMLSSRWNHSDDEMYYVGYWGLYRYAFTPELKAIYKDAIIDHWEAERPEKEGLWNIFTAITGAADFDLEEAIWYLREHPLDLIDWGIANSHRKDIDFVQENFRGQTLTEVLPPDERPIQRHNANMFRLDRNGSGTSEHSAGDIWLLPYWMGRYLNIISAPQKN